MENKLIECDRCHHDFLEKKLYDLDNNVFCWECFEKEFLLTYLEKETQYLINLDKHVINDVQKLPFEFGAFGIKNTAFNIPNYSATKISKILSDFVVDNREQADTFNSNFIIIEIN